MVEGRFARFVHDHYFEPTDFEPAEPGTLTRDVVQYAVPWGWIGKAFDGLVLRRYLTRLLRRRSEAVKESVEGPPESEV